MFNLPIMEIQNFRADVLFRVSGRFLFRNTAGYIILKAYYWILYVKYMWTRVSNNFFY